MKKNLLSKLTDNLALKIISVIVAIVIWYVVVDYNDPVVQRSISGVPVQVENGAYIANGTRVYHIDEQYKTISVVVEGNRSVVSGLTASDIQITADMTQIVDLTTNPVYVPLQASCAGLPSDSVILPRTTIPVTIEDVASRDFAIAVDTDSTRPASGFEIGSMRANIDTLTISGPQSMVDKIGSVVAVIDVSGMSESGSRTAELHIYDKADNELSAETLRDDLTFDGGGIPEISVQVELWRKRTGVRLQADGYTGEPEEGYEVSEITTTPEDITVAGTEEALKKLNDLGNVITIPASLVSVDGADDDIQIRDIEIADLLPDGLMLASNVSSTVTVNVTVLPYGSREFSLDVSDISVQNLSSGLAVSYDTKELEVRIQGTEEDLEELAVSQISASINLSGRMAGDYTVPVDISLPGGYELVNPVSISVHLRESTGTVQQN